MSAPRLDARDVAAMLAERIETPATALVGSGPTSKGPNAWRFYPRGGLVITICGAKRGLWCHHGDGAVGGDALDLVAHLRQCSIAEALAWARAWLGIPDDKQTPAPVGRPVASPEARSSEPKSTVPLARQIWNEAVPAAGT